MSHHWQKYWEDCNICRNNDEIKSVSFFWTTLYISIIDLYCFRVAIAQAILGVLPSNNSLHQYRISPLRLVDRNCTFCISETEKWTPPFIWMFRIHWPENKTFEGLLHCICTVVTSSKQEILMIYIRSVSKFLFHAVISVNKRKRRY